MSLSRLRPSVSRKDQRMYDSLRLKLRSSRGHLKAEANDDARPDENASEPRADPMEN